MVARPHVPSDRDTIDELNRKIDENGLYTIVMFSQGPSDIILKKKRFTWKQEKKAKWRLYSKNKSY